MICLQTLGVYYYLADIMHQSEQKMHAGRTRSAINANNPLSRKHNMILHALAFFQGHKQLHLI